MFLRKLVRSLSLRHKNGADTGSRSEQDQRGHRRQRQRLTRSPSTSLQVRSAEVAVDATSFSPSAKPAPAARPRAVARSQTLPTPKSEAEPAAHDPQLHSSASATATTGAVSNYSSRSSSSSHNSHHHNSQYLDRNSASYISDTITSTSTPYAYDILLKSSTTAPVLNYQTVESPPVFESADHDLDAPNFPFRPLHLQTLSPNTDHDLTVDTAKEIPLFTPSSLLPEPTKSPHSNETGSAMQRKLWVKRPGASATRVEVSEDDLVDNVRDVILHKYANSLGRHIDSPDITLKIVSREQTNKSIAAERVLGPEEEIGRTLDTYYPGGQTIEEALIIEVPQKRTPKPSPRPGNHHVSYYMPDDYRPGDGARDYFPPMPLHSPHIAHVQHPAGPNGNLPVHSMSVLTTGQVPALPSPGGHSRTRHVRPKYPRQHTSSPTIVHASQTNGIDGKSQLNGVTTAAQPLPTPPAATGDKSTVPPPNRATSPHSGKQRRKRQPTGGRDINGEPPLPTKPASAKLLDGRVPPINVLLVEDNVINLKLLEQFMKRLKVRWQSAMNGREAVNMWRKGGFHLVLMDIQLPVMNGLEATKEIRRLESVNGIGLSVFGDATDGVKTNGHNQPATEDKLEDRGLFKSPVIIVALTASSLQSDRHEALAVGCNDFLTKPVNFVWMERKVTEWGCMQALIDFDGWRRWKAIAEKKESGDPEKRKQEEKDEKAKAKAALKAMFTRPPPSRPAPASKRDGSNESAKKEDPSAGSSSGATTTTASAAEQPSNRRSHKGSRSQSGSMGTALDTTMEVDEKEG